MIFASPRQKYGTRYLFISANPKHTLPSDVILRRINFSQPILTPSGPCNAPWFSSETLTLYKSLTYLLTYNQVTAGGQVQRPRCCLRRWLSVRHVYKRAPVKHRSQCRHRRTTRRWSRASRPRDCAQWSGPRVRWPSYRASERWTPCLAAEV